MLAKQHLIYGYLFLMILLFILGIAGIINFTGLFVNTYFVVGMLGYFVGLILPDSDSNNKGSTIYYTPLFPVAFVCRFIERKRAHKHGFSIGHRGFLHKPIGILYTSLASAIIFTLIIYLIWKTPILSLLFCFIAIYLGLFFGQIVHIVQDHIGN